MSALIGISSCGPMPTSGEIPGLETSNKRVNQNQIQMINPNDYQPMFIGNFKIDAIIPRDSATCRYYMTGPNNTKLWADDDCGRTLKESFKFH